MNKVLTIIITVIITALVVGSWVYYWQNQNSSDEIVVENVKTESTDLSVVIEENTNKIEDVDDVLVEKNDDEPVNTDLETQSTNVYVSSNLGYALTVPEKWNEYGYKVEYKYTPKGQDDYGLESWEETFVADFPEWSDFELITIGSVPKPIYYAEKLNYEEALEVGPADFGPYNSPRYLWGDKLEETDTHVFYSFVIRQDAPQEFFDDGSVMPDMEKDFVVL